jgi:membrane fusion protein, multidrug efflux system
MKSVEVMKRVSMVISWLALLVAVGCHREVAEKHEEKGKFLATSPLRKDSEITREYVSQIRAIQHIELRAQERGYLTGIFVDEGQIVEHGKKMFQVMPLIYQAELQKAEAEAEFAGLEYQNTKVLADGTVVSPNELALSKAKRSKAQAELELAKVHRALTELKAPFTGIMGRFQVRLGSLVDEGDLLTTLSDNRTVWVYFNVTEAEYLDYKTRAAREGNPISVRLMMANGQVFEQTGKIETIEADFNNETGNIAFRAAFANPDGLLRHGETGKVLMTTPLRNALIIPQQATFDILDKKFVFVIDDKNIAHVREITVAHEMPQLYVIESGLSEQDKILIDGLRKVRDGNEIAIDYQPPAEVYAHLEPSVK